MFGVHIGNKNLRIKTKCQPGIESVSWQYASPWEELRGQILLGEADFVDAHKDLLHDKKAVKGLPRSKRYVNRPRLSRLFGKSGNKTQRDQAIQRAYLQHGYTMKSIADHSGIHYTTVSRVIKAQEEI